MQRIPDTEESEHEVLSPMSDGHGVHPEIRIIREHADAFAGGCQGLADHGRAYFKSGRVGEALSADSIIEHCADTKISGHGYERPLDEFLEADFLPPGKRVFGVALGPKERPAYHNGVELSRRRLCPQSKVSLTLLGYS